MKRSRGRGRRPQSNHGGHSHNPNRTFDSAGPEIKIRGSASHVYEKYLQLARDANSSGDRVTAENYLQHAEHYYRIMAAQAVQQQQYQAQQQQQQAVNGNGQQPGQRFPQVPGPSEAYGQGGSAPSFNLTEGTASEEDAEELGD